MDSETGLVVPFYGKLPYYRYFLAKHPKLDIQLFNKLNGQFKKSRADGRGWTLPPLVRSEA